MLKRLAEVQHVLPTLAVGALLLLAVPLFFPGWFSGPPLGKHAWAQADHYSIAEKFSEQPTFFTPHSHNLRPDFMGEQRTDLTSGITRADFPVPHFVAGLLMRWTGGGYGLVRWIFYLFSISGICMLARLWMRESGRPWWSVILVAGAFGGPLWLYFSTAMMPSTVALSALLWALVGWFRYRENDDATGLIWTVVALALAALFRPPYAVFGLGFGWWLVESGRLVRKRELGVLLPALALCIAYTFHSLNLGHQHGSLFLSGFDWGMEPGEQLRMGLSGLGEHFPVISGLAVAALLAVVVSVGRKEVEGKIVRAGLLVVLLSLTYQYLVAPQFVHHDYYLLDTWVPLLLVALTVFMHTWKRRAGIVVLVVLAGAATGWVRNGWQYEREANQTFPQGRALAAFANSEGLLDDLGVAVDAKVLVLDAYSTNQALLFQNRSGYFVPATDSIQLTWALDWPWDVVLVPRESMEADWVHAHQLPSKWICVGSNGLCNVYRAASSGEHPQSREDFLGDTLWKRRCWNTTAPAVNTTDEFPKGVEAPASWCNQPGPVHFKVNGTSKQAGKDALLVMRNQNGYAQFAVPARGAWSHEVTLLSDSGPYQVYFWNRGNAPLEVSVLEVEVCVPE